MLAAPRMGMEVVRAGWLTRTQTSWVTLTTEKLGHTYYRKAGSHLLRKSWVTLTTGKLGHTYYGKACYRKAGSHFTTEKLGHIYYRKAGSPLTTGKLGHTLLWKSWVTLTMEKLGHTYYGKAGSYLLDYLETYCLETLTRKLSGKPYCCLGWLPLTLTLRLTL